MLSSIRASDLVLQAIFPFSGFLVGALVSAVASHLLFGRALPAGDGAHTPFGQ
jgi:hypothetical protein